MLEWLKWLIARREMAELERWRIRWHETRQWLGEFPDAASALDQLRQQVDGVHMMDIQRLRDNMRARRVELATERRKRERGARLTDHRFCVDGGED